MEGAAGRGPDPGQPGDRRRAAARLPGRRRSDPGALLARSPAAPGWAAADGARDAAEEVDRRACLPAIVRAHLLGGHAVPGAPDRVDRVPAVQRARSGDRPRTAPRRGRAPARRARAAGPGGGDRYEVCFLDSDIAADGGKIRLSAGAPRVVGDDEERMLLALRQIVEADPPLPVQVGVNRGPVFTGEVGPDYRRWYAVMGDTVNLAARVMGKAPLGHIYATRDVLRHAPGALQQTEVGPFTVKGKARPVEAWDVGPPMRPAGAQAARPRAAAGRPRARARALCESAIVGRAARRGSAGRAGRRDRQRQVAAARRGPEARRGHGGAALDLRGGHARDAVLRLARAAASAARRRMGRSGRARARAARGRDPRQRPGAAPVAAADRDRGRRGGAGTHRGRRSSPPTPAPRSCARSCCSSSDGRWSCRRSSRSSTPI